MANPKTLKPWKKGQSGNPNGRPKSIRTTLAAQGYSIAQINQVIKILLSMTVEELTKIVRERKEDILTVTAAAALLKSLGKGQLDAMEALISRTYGRPVTHNEVFVGDQITFEIKPRELPHKD